MSETEILEVTDSGGEPLAYYLLGHNSDVSDGELAERVASMIGDPSLEDDILGEICREWWREAPCDCGEHGSHYVRAKAGEPGALAVTAWLTEGDGWLGPSPSTPENKEVDREK
jgi:hypothetical protein